MSDNDAGNMKDICHDDLPKWVRDISDKHGLAKRGSSPLDVAVMLMTDAASLLQGICDVAFRECTLSDEAKRQIVRCKTMVADAERLYPLCRLHRTSAAILPFRQSSSHLDT